MQDSPQGATADSASSTPPNSSKDDTTLLRQRERTIDNVKRLFAVVFALSFTTMGRNAYETLKPYIIGDAAPAAVHVWGTYLEMVVVFVVTASVFYHQGAKFLDWRYASAASTEAHPAGFAWDFAVVFGTMIPFILMANSLDPAVTSKVGFTAFFFSYVLLISQGLVLLLWAEFRHSKYFRGSILRTETMAEEELDRDAVLRTYWLAMNGLVYFIIALLFNLAISHGLACPIRVGSQFPWFLIAFGVVTMCRDWLDFAWAWPFVYPVEKPHYRWPLTWIIERPWWISKWDGYLVVGLVIVALAFVEAFYFDAWWNYGYWTRVCIP